MDDWTTLKDLEPGCLFITANGIRAVKSEYHYPNGNCQCILIESGEYAHFSMGNDTKVRYINIPSGKLRQNALVKFKRGKYSKEYEEKYYKDLLDKTFIYLGEIPNQPGHCVLIEIGSKPDLAGRLELFRHIEDFEELPEEEI